VIHPLFRISAALFFPLAPVFAIRIADESPEVNYRFSSGFGTAEPVANSSPDFVGAGYDLSGLGWWSQLGSQQRVKHTTLIAPMFSVNAAHYPFAVGDTVNFLSADGDLVTNTVASRSTAWSDVSVTRYGSAFTASDEVAVFRTLDISSSDYTNQPLLIAGSRGNSVPGGATIGTELATSMIQGVGITGVVNPFSNAQNGAFSYIGPDTGDSGSPIFLPYQDELTLVSALDFVLFPSANTTAVNALLSTYGYAQRFTIYDVPADVANTANVWTGGAGNAEFFAGANWSKGAAPGQLPVVFDAGANGGQNIITLNANQALRGMLFRTNAGTDGFVFQGSGTLTLGTTGLRNEDGKTQTFNVAMSLSGAQNWEAAEGDLIFNGNIANAGSLLVVQGAKTTTINGVLSGTGGLAKDEGGTLVLGGTNTYSGKTFLHNGVLKAGADNVFSTASAVAFDTGNAGALLDLDGRSAGVGNLQSELDGKGRVALKGGTLSTGYLNTSATYAGTFEGSGRVVKQGTGIWTLTGDNTGYTGSLEVANGIIQLGAPHALGGGQNMVHATGRVQTTTSLEVHGALTFSATHNGSTVAVAGFGGNVLAALGAGTTVTYHDAITLDRQGTGTGELKYNFRTAGAGAQQLVIAGDVTSSGSNTGVIGFEAWTPGSAQNVIDFQGRIAEGPGGPQIRFNVTGTGTTMLSHAAGNGYTGTTVVFTGANLLVNNQSGSGTGSGAVDVRSAASLGGTGIIAPGGSNGLTAASGATLAPGSGGLGVLEINLASTTGRSVFQPGARFVFDLASPGLSDTLDFSGLSAGDVVFHGNVVDFTNLGGLAPGNYTLFTFDTVGAYTGTLAVGIGLEGFEASFVYNSQSIELSVVPEPGPGVLTLAALGFLTVVCGRKRTPRVSFSQGMSAKHNAPPL
jgi:autotransporter-associated beta strand protein